MTVRLYRSTDISAPVLAGQVGSLIALLDAVLVNGYSLLGITSITRSGNTATVTMSANNSTLVTGDRVTISGANEADYNGQFTITWVNATTFTYNVLNSPTTPATGTLFYGKSAVGWTKEFSGTNLAAYRQPAGTSEFRMRVDDTVAASSRFLGYEVMTDVNTGTGPFPTNVQLASGLYAVKSSTADATARPWTLLTNEKIVYLFINTTSAAIPVNSYLVFGDFTSYKAGDTYGCCAIGATSAATTLVAAPFPSCNAVVSVGGQTGHYAARDHTGVGSAIGLGKVTNTALSGKANTTLSANEIVFGGASSASGAYTPLTYASPVDAGLYVERVWLTQNANALRGELPGIWAPMHNYPLVHLDTYTGVGAVAGKKFEAQGFANTYNGQIHIETSDTW